MFDELRGSFGGKYIELDNRWMLNEDHSGPSTNFGSGKFGALEISRASSVATWSQMFRTSLWIFNRNVIEEHYNSNKDMHAGGKITILAEDHFMHQPPMFKTSEAMEVKPST
ncbi:hypothetical protein BTUL_0143g00260 [Botrytis tulipae]|uniref:Uncharacterized protein n=1 Tax=Botrytis tulipae TaxID=87230 RepID=A0A4Z1ED17_9HELO|nr:hypothetical protein BTUL_0143g00260 [Botrytis tulipae]